MWDRREFLFLSLWQCSWMEEFKRCIDSNLNANWIHKCNHSNTTMMNFFSNQYACIPAAISSLFKPQKLFFSVTCQQLYFWVTTNGVPPHVFILKTPQVRYIHTVVQEAQVWKCVCETYTELWVLISSPSLSIIPTHDLISLMMIAEKRSFCFLILFPTYLQLQTRSSSLRCQTASVIRWRV